MDMTPSRPYLMRALNEWILDNECTPYVLVDASLPGVQVPEDYVNNGQIVLNISPGAVKTLHIDGNGLSFNARFGGVPIDIYSMFGLLRKPFNAATGTSIAKALCLAKSNLTSPPAFAAADLAALALPGVNLTITRSFAALLLDALLTTC